LKDYLGERIEELDWSRLIPDVRPFLEKEEEVGLLSPVNLWRVLDLDRSSS